MRLWNSEAQMSFHLSQLIIRLFRSNVIGASRPRDPQTPTPERPSYETPRRWMNG